MESRIAANYNDATQLGRVARGQYGAHGRLHIVALEILPFCASNAGNCPQDLQAQFRHRWSMREGKNRNESSKSYRFPAAVS